MRVPRYDTTGSWFKGNVHLHSMASDGGKTFKELSELYASAGYDFLFRTDHWVASDCDADQAGHPLLWLDGVELDGEDSTGAAYHVVCLGRVEGLEKEAGFIAGLELARQQGAFLLLAHPHWCGNSLEDSLRWSFDGVEIYNHVCHWLNGKSYGGVHWDAMLQRDPDTLAFAVDDAHLKPGHLGWNGGWIVVNAADCTQDAIMRAIRKGSFYSSCGPRIESIQLEGGVLSVTCSPVSFARVVGPCHRGERVGSFDGLSIGQFQLPVPDDWDYAYLEIEDAAGQRAWTNNLWSNEEDSE